MDAKTSDFKVEKREFDALLAKLINSPASVKDGIKATKVRRKSAARNKAPRRP
jgi:hypothetical protein